MERGRFLVLEGPDGCGKSTMLEAIRRHLEAKGRAARYLRDPGGTAVGDKVRAILLDRKHTEMGGLTELMLYLACRAQLVEEVLRPALEAGETVICDRFFLSTLVYQGAAEVLPEAALREIVLLGLDDVWPDRILVLDVPAEAGLERAGRHPDRMELKGLTYHTRVRERYLAFAENDFAGICDVIDATETLLEVKKTVLEAVDDVLG